MHAHGDAVRDGASPVASTKALLMQRAACQEVRGHAPRRRLGEGGAVLQAEVDGALAAGRQVERQVQARGPGVRLAGGRPQRCMSGPAELKSVHTSSCVMPQLDPHYARVQGCQSYGVTGSRLHVCSSSYRTGQIGRKQLIRRIRVAWPHPQCLSSQLHQRRAVMAGATQRQGSLVYGECLRTLVHTQRPCKGRQRRPAGCPCICRCCLHGAQQLPEGLSSCT